MSEQRPGPGADRAVINGLVALVAVALGVGLVVALVALAGTRMLGLGGDDASAAGGSTTGGSMYLPSPVETTSETGPRITLHTDGADEVVPEEEGEAEAEPSESESESEDAEKISLQAATNAVRADERIQFSGVYPGGEGAILWVERWQDGGWSEFPASVNVTNGTFSSYIFTGQSGLNRFRVVDRDRNIASNEIRIQVG
ncbi:hypothetical protein JK386_01280 [Nocardioides sp. zg-536]|uniref:Uncharacterized protein n=1 Tax=Nocardioides faecalis TaxID=2803858 RepID=A0A938Y3L0_9ACTN|nr:hypothetical protein [Nocardioides faecalis]MBM9458527.1 hypothetical protein [Nocardioides faecalis]MBS4752858.1 hypothetical protein [Nocardioides faecalis]QVI58531.1 hypothetical protein KG111_16370 [Nocardioides faecalis]